MGGGKAAGERHLRAKSAVLVRAEKVWRSYGSVNALRGVDLALASGRITGLVGANGSGKTTLLRLLAGCLGPTSGRVWRRDGLTVGLALDSDEVLYRSMTVAGYLEHLAAIAPIAPKAFGPRDAMTALGLWTDRFHTVGTLSRGYRQRVLLAQALLGAPDLLLLDEPFNALDPRQTADVMKLLRHLEWKPGIVVSSHVLPHLIEVVDELVVIDRGELMAQRTVQEFFEPAHVNGTLGVRIAALAPPDRFRTALSGYELLDLTSQGGVSAAVVVPRSEAFASLEALASEILGCLASSEVPVVAVAPRQLCVSDVR